MNLHNGNLIYLGNNENSYMIFSMQREIRRDMRREIFDAQRKMTWLFVRLLFTKFNVKPVKMIINLNIIFSYNYRLSFALFL